MDALPSCESFVTDQRQVQFGGKFAKWGQVVHLKKATRETLREGNNTFGHFSLDAVGR